MMKKNQLPHCRNNVVFLCVRLHTDRQCSTIFLIIMLISYRNITVNPGHTNRIGGVMVSVLASSAVHHIRVPVESNQTL